MRPDSGPDVPAAARRAVRGGYDLHVHVEPDLIGRSIDDVGLARVFLAHGLRGFALKSHYAPTGERAAVVRRAVPGVEAIGTITLNHGVGGLNPVAVEIAGRSEARIVWLPTVDARNEARDHSTMARPPAWAQMQREMAGRIAMPAPIDQKVFIEAGPAKHAIAQTFFLYAYEPSGNRIEVCSGGQLIFDPEYKPVVWTQAERARGQAWGTPTVASFHTYGTPVVETPR